LHTPSAITQLACCHIQPLQPFDQARSGAAADGVGGLCHGAQAGADERSPLRVVEADEAQLLPELPPQASHGLGDAQRDHRIARDHRGTASSSASLSPSTLSNTSPATRGSCAATQAPKAAVRSRRELTPFCGSVT
jgi:hypothetical protein